MTFRTARLWQRLINGASLIGVLVAVGAAILAYESAEHSVRAQYVAIAAGILNAPKGQSDADLRIWATRVLKQYSEIPLPESVISGLESGRITLSGEAKDTTRAEGSLDDKMQPKNEDVIMSDPSALHFWMDWGVQAVVGAGTLLVAGAAIFADAVKAKFVRLSVMVDSTLGTYQPFVKALQEGDQIVGLSGSIPARYYQLRVTNGCRLFPAHRTTLWLLKIDRNEAERLMTWRGEIPLTWQHADFIPGPRVIGGHPVLADLATISSEGVLAIQVRNPPVGLKHTFKGACELWVTVQARSDESSSDEYRVHIKWDGNWDLAVDRMKVEFKGCRIKGSSS